MPSASTLTCGLLVLAAFFATGEAIRCWTCSSDLDPRCGDPYNTTIDYNTRGHRYSLTDCNAQSSGSSYPYITAARSVCKKSKQLINGDMTVIRGCAWQTPDQPIGPCPTDSTSHVRTVFCETCDTEGCNSGRMLAAIPILAFLALPAAILLR